METTEVWSMVDTLPHVAAFFGIVLIIAWVIVFRTGD